MNDSQIKKFFDEKQRRDFLKKQDNHAIEIIGSEIKKIRKEKKLTLEAVASKICSQSYLSKIENNKIKGNFEILREICERESLSNKDFDLLLESKNMLEDVLLAYIEKRREFINEKCDEFPFSNYRTDILKLIYYISQKQYDVASEIYSKIIDYVSSISEFDYIVFSIMSGFLFVNTYHFSEAIKTVKDLDNYLLNDEFAIARLLVLFNANFGLNNPSIIEYYKELEILFVKYLKVDLLEELRYYLCLYFIKNDADDMCNRYLKGINNKKYIESIDVINCFKNGKFENINSSYKNLTTLAECLRDVSNNRKAYLSKMRNINGFSFDMDYDVLFVKYFVNNNPKDKLDYIFDVVLPILVKSNDGFLKNYYLKEISYLDAPKKASYLSKYLMAFNNEKVFSL